MVVKDVDIQFKKSGGSANEDPDLSLGGNESASSTARFFTDNFLHNCYDEVQIAEAQSGDTEYRHIYVTNLKTYELKNCVFTILTNTKERWSKVFFAKGTAANGIREQAVANEDTAPVGIAESAWVSSGSINLGTIASGLFASVWSKRVVEPGALIVDNEKVVVRVTGDPPAGTNTGTCPAGQHWDPVTLQCVDNAVTCPTGMHLDTTTNQCVPDDGGQGGGGGGGTGGGGGGGPSPLNVFAAAVGDIGCDQNASDVVTAIKAIDDSVPNFDPTGPTRLDVFLANGDLSYASSIDCFVSGISEVNLSDITKVTIGNHDADEDGSDSIGQEALSTYGLPASGYYSFNIQNVHFLAMNTQISYSSSSAQRSFVAQDLAAAAANSSIKWIVVYYHKPSLTAPSNHSPLTDFRDIYHPLFDQYKVDLVIQSHNHNMQRSLPVKYNASSPSSPTVQSTASNNIFTNIDGRVFIVSGAGGRSHHGLGSIPSYIRYSNDNDYGFFFFHTDQAVNAMYGYFITTASSNNLEVLDTFQIVKT